MAASIGHLGSVFNPHRMVMEYAERAYFTAHRAGDALAADRHVVAESLAQWRERVSAAWPTVTVRSEVGPGQTLRVGDAIAVDIWAALGMLGTDEVLIEAVAGRPGADGRPTDGDVVSARHVGAEGAEQRYVAEVPLSDAGQLAITVRARPINAVGSANPYRHFLLTVE